MGHLTEIKPSTYVLNLSKFEETELAKRKKKSTPVKQVGRSTEAEQVSTVPAVDATVPAVDDKTVMIKQAKVSYDEHTRLYTIEFKGEFYDDSRDLDKTMRVVRELVPGVTEKELSALKDL